MRFFAILLALLLTGCKVTAPEAGGYDKVVSLLANPFKQCRDKDTGRYAKCQTCPDGSRIAVSDECPLPPPPATQTCPDGSVIPADQTCPPPPPPPTQICPDGSVIPADQVCPAPPPPSGWESSPSLDGAAPIASEFDPKAGLIAVPLAKSASPDVVGAFRFVCDAGQLLNDDPIVFPGQPGKSHLHQFYGNTGANAFSTYKSLRTSGQSTCSVDPLNRSAYWMPAMLDGKGNVVRPDHVQIYYKRRPKSDPKCQGFANQGEGICEDIPNGLKFIFGYDMVSGKTPTGSTYFMCVASGITTSPHEANLAGDSIQSCPVGGRVTATIKAPGCWDGKNLDSPNHRDHVAYAVRDANTGVVACPATHPYVIPGFTLTASYSILDGDDPRLWSLSSDAMHPELPRGSTFHADFDMAWDPVIRGLWHDNCIDLMLNCSAGDLGNGLMMRNVLKADPHLVPIP